MSVLCAFLRVPAPLGCKMYAFLRVPRPPRKAAGLPRPPRKAAGLLGLSFLVFFAFLKHFLTFLLVKHARGIRP